MSTSATLEPMAEMMDEMAESLPTTIDRVVLTGFMGSGKTTTGRLLAEQLGWNFRDLDSEVERREGRTVPQIFAESGEAEFRRLESAALASLLGQRRLVLALGGGAPEVLGNRLLLEQTPRTAVVYLQAPLETLVERCERAAETGETERPLLGEAETRLRRRHPLYDRLADHKVTTTALDVEQVCEAVLVKLRG
ncbi:AAA family ATPase [Granulicella sp. 5B5]|uniref:shikimate kinase n=1 Tax=Granulicella sp. 5B5 TaxID=1617967 RepID=UPI0017719ABD|nr:shikimate kinase [Granulicella sp. 5B5]QMV19519.1 AAA family ATPase [Granulicella sp. 5B5]